MCPSVPRTASSLLPDWLLPLLLSPLTFPCFAEYQLNPNSRKKHSIPPSSLSPNPSVFSAKHLGMVLSWQPPPFTQGRKLLPVPIRVPDPGERWDNSASDPLNRDFASQSCILGLIFVSREDVGGAKPRVHPPPSASLKHLDPDPNFGIC